MEFDELSKKVIGLAIEVHRELGPGLLENTYKQCLAYELNRAKINFKWKWIYQSITKIYLFLVVIV
jgi:GxxExxY protein